MFKYAVLYEFSYSTHAQYGIYSTVGAFNTSMHHTLKYNTVVMGGSEN